jgi:hypothetical protein
MTTNNPTLRRGDEGVDGWVEYLQTLLRVKGFEGVPEVGVFDAVTEHWVRSYQEMHHLEGIDGIVGDETWASLRLEPEAQPMGTDGRDPHSFTDHGIKLRFTTEGSYEPYDDWIWCRAFSVGDTPPQSGSIEAVVSIRFPDGSSQAVRAVHENEDDYLQAFRIWNATNAGPAGRYAMLMQLPMETGGDTFEFEFDRPHV